MRSFDYEISKARYEDMLAAAAKARQAQAVTGRRSTRRALGGTLIAIGRRLENPHPAARA